MAPPHTKKDDARVKDNQESIISAHGVRKSTRKKKGKTAISTLSISKPTVRKSVIYQLGQALSHGANNFQKDFWATLFDVVHSVEPSYLASYEMIDLSKRFWKLTPELRNRIVSMMVVEAGSIDVSVAKNHLTPLVARLNRAFFDRYYRENTFLLPVSHDPRVQSRTQHWVQNIVHNNGMIRPRLGNVVIEIGIFAISGNDRRRGEAPVLGHTRWAPHILLEQTNLQLLMDFARYMLHRAHVIWTSVMLMDDIRARRNNSRYKVKAPKEIAERVTNLCIEAVDEMPALISDLWPNIRPGATRYQSHLDLYLWRNNRLHLIASSAAVLLRRLDLAIASIWRDNAANFELIIARHEEEKAKRPKMQVMRWDLRTQALQLN